MSAESVPAGPLRFKEKLAYGLGDTASNFYLQAFNLFLFYYYTDVFGLPPAAVGTMMLFTRLLDAVTDPLMGIVADRTRTRWGAYRPFLRWVAIPYGIAGYVMFLDPGFGLAGKLAFAYVTYSLTWLAYTAINIPYSALMGVMSPVSAERTTLSTYRFGCAFAGAFLISALTLPLKDLLGGDDPAAGFRRTMGIFAVASVVLFWFTFQNTRERVKPEASEPGSVGRDLRNLFRNGPWLALFVCAFFTLANVGVRNASIIYYFRYNVGDESKFTLFSMLGTLVFIGGALSTKLWLRFWSRRTALLVFTFGNAVAMGAFYFVDPQSMVTLHVLNVVGTFMAGPMPAIVWSLYADTADYGEWKFGRRATALVFSAAVFAQKVGMAVGSALLGWLLDHFGFVPNAEQGERALFGIKLMFSVLPAAFAILGGVAVLFYPLTEERVREIERELTARRQVG